jgi:hypothetical protein
MKFDYDTPAELFMAKRKGGARQPLGYRRFPSAAEAVRFAIEEFPGVRTLGAWMQVGDERFDCDAIQRLYDSKDYPLRRRAAKSNAAKSDAAKSDASKSNAAKSN